MIGSIKRAAFCLAFSLLFAAFPIVESSAAASYGKGGTKTEAKASSDLTKAAFVAGSVGYDVGGYSITYGGIRPAIRVNPSE